ncbi:MAG: glutaminyl-peptide cyclotransferase [Sedimentisphaerales bacterium]|nr:glutaminyl-peptide cyclotransferase [Sedimentisphaerales bacterium]HNY79131.1 glutaminyl-peptide cyclotransferase [Sedimentisphaerales bacterium]HOC64173.1 glutaminyl-peptide cyclotransferase [Sedimentisphaerales bacterium]HPY49937.1 glutaminyl-peptide cyclotransferase [Sedimentisphaerales bacterium]
MRWALNLRRGLRMAAMLVLWAGVTLPAGRVAIATQQSAEANSPPPETAPPPEEAPVVYYGYNIVRTYPHDERNFTQGLVYEDGYLYEGTGLYKQSVLTRRHLESGRYVKRLRLPDQYFGEGIALFGDKVIQLTWKSEVAFVYDKTTFRELEQFHFSGQGWGLTSDGTRLILSDGTSVLRFLDPNTYVETGRLRVHNDRRPVRQINELEFIDGQIYANILPTDYIAIISPQTGRITGWIDLTGLYIPPEYSPSNIVLNGIAYIPETRHLLVTGKCWPKIYEIELVPQTAEP